MGVESSWRFICNYHAASLPGERRNSWKWNGATNGISDGQSLFSIGDWRAKCIKVKAMRLGWINIKGCIWLGTWACDLGLSWDNTQLIGTERVCETSFGTQSGAAEGGMV